VLGAVTWEPLVDLVVFEDNDASTVCHDGAEWLSQSRPLIVDASRTNPSALRTDLVGSYDGPRRNRRGKRDPKAQRQDSLRWVIRFTIPVNGIASTDRRCTFGNGGSGVDEIVEGHGLNLSLPPLRPRIKASVIRFGGRYKCPRGRACWHSGRRRAGRFQFGRRIS
jgi:hypothetical protein